MKRLRRLIGMAVLLIVAHIFVPATAAHPLGNFTINHYAGLHVQRDAISIDYVLDMAEIPAFQEIRTLDANRNDRPDSAEIAGYDRAQCEAIRSQLDLWVNGRPRPMVLETSGVEFPPGVGGLLTLRLTCTFRTSMAPTSNAALQVEFKDNTYAERLGWRELVVTAEGVSLRGEFMTRSISDRLITYPDDLLASPLDQRQVTFDVVPLASRVHQPTQENVFSQPLGQPGGGHDDAFTKLVTLQTLSLPTLLLALAISVIWGAMHALSPGHGKTIVGAYLVGARGTAKHAIFLGLTTTITHTAGVFALGLVTIFASQFIVPERLYPWLSAFSGLLIVGIGINLFVSRLRNASALVPADSDHTHGDGPHRLHGHEDHLHHHHDHGHDRAYSHSDHSHLPPGVDGSPVTWRSLLALGISGGLLPCPSALIVLLSAIALDRASFGLVLVLAFSVGLAGVLTGIGLLFVYAGRLFGRLPMDNRAVRLVPAMSAAFVTLAGLAIMARALVQVGLLQL